ncbi:RNA-directed DNA polymerase, eukaryota, reverse transcriptase zinc-binding domain protein [Tanacetum coccineum]|uniref:RNA-directed DNA polymerase, eukaryota, reverse transcriptase zinc-binding domain protein n=1 Tax=Tanacetum coccineum TaxID=301880 RepID=A0ABQ5BSY7_9ASTR
MADKGSPKTGWNVQHDVISSIRKSANKYAVLDEDNEIESLLAEEKEVDNEVIDVYEETSGSAKKMTRNEIGSSYVDVLNGPKGWGNMKNLIMDEKLNVYVILETRIKGIMSRKWEICCLENGVGMIILLNVVSLSVIMGDLNVSLNQDDHSEGIFGMTQDIEEFSDCINTIKMEDIYNNGLHFTWTKSLFNPKTSILNNIDRVIGNEKFLKDHLRAHVVFLPYGISDHNPAVLSYPRLIKLKSKSFRFANYIADMDGFLDLAMNKLNWKNGNLLKNVKKLKSRLDDIQIKIDVDPSNIHLREQGVSVFHEYVLAFEDEEKLLLQKTKVKWLKEGDRNSAFFHKVLKGRTNRSRFEEICGEDNVKYSCGQIDNHEADKMIGEFTNEEIKYEIFDIDDNKSPSPDGYTTKFFKNLGRSMLLKGYDCIRGPKRCAVKIDIQKAYDTVNWKFLENALRMFGFHSKMVNCIMTCVSTPSHTICLNGKRYGYFKGGRGLRQGDPITFFKYHHGCKGLKITHLCFADDLLVLYYGDVESAIVIKKALDKFSDVSGGEKLELHGKRFPILRQIPTPNLNIEIKDKLLWKTSNGITKEFSSNQVWKDLKILNGHVQWWKVIWFSQNVPRQAFVLWMAMKKKLVTQDKLVLWYPVWSKVQVMANVSDLKNLENNVCKFLNMPYKNSIWSIVRRLTIASTVYHIWQERNLKVFQKMIRSPQILIQIILDSVKSRLLSLKVKNSSVVKAVKKLGKITYAKAINQGSVKRYFLEILDLNEFLNYEGSSVSVTSESLVYLNDIEVDVAIVPRPLKDDEGVGSLGHKDVVEGHKAVVDGRIQKESKTVEEHSSFIQGGGSFVGSTRPSEVENITMSFHTTLKVDNLFDEHAVYQTITDLICEHDSLLRMMSLWKSVTDEAHRLRLSLKQADRLSAKLKKDVQARKARWKAEKICLVNKLKKYVEEKETVLGEKATILEEKESVLIHARDKEIKLDGLLIADQENIACLEAELPNIKALTNESFNKVSVVEAENKELVSFFPTFERRVVVYYMFGNEVAKVQRCAMTLDNSIFSMDLKAKHLGILDKDLKLRINAQEELRHVSIKFIFTHWTNLYSLIDNDGLPLEDLNKIVLLIMMPLPHQLNLNCSFLVDNLYCCI